MQSKNHYLQSDIKESYLMSLSRHRSYVTKSNFCSSLWEETFSSIVGIENFMQTSDDYPFEDVIDLYTPRRKRNNTSVCDITLLTQTQL